MESNTKENNKKQKKTKENKLNHNIFALFYPRA